MSITMYDTTDTNPSPIPHDAQAVAGYVGGRWPSFNELVRQYPNAHHLSIAIAASEDAQCLDIEAGDATPSQAPEWVRRQRARGESKPWLYANLSTWESELRGIVNNNGLEVIRWVADWDGSPSIPVGYDAKQYTDHGPHGENYDITSVRDGVFAPAPPPDPHHYLWFPNEPVTAPRSPWGVLSERDRVQHYDGARAHPILYALYLRRLRSQLGWLAGRVLSVAHESDPPNWDANRRGWRYQQLIQRAHGARLA